MTLQANAMAMVSRYSLFCTGMSLTLVFGLNVAPGAAILVHEAVGLMGSPPPPPGTPLPMSRSSVRSDSV